jgi:hypothetical protein
VADTGATLRCLNLLQFLLDGVAGDSGEVEGLMGNGGLGHLERDGLMSSLVCGLFADLIPSVNLPSFLFGSSLPVNLSFLVELS